MDIGTKVLLVLMLGIINGLIGTILPKDIGLSFGLSYLLYCIVSGSLLGIYISGK